LKHLIDVINKENEPDIKKLRNKALLLLGFSGGFRRNELVSLDIEDIEFVFEGLKVTLKKSKTDQFGEGFTKGIPHFDHSLYCPVTSLKRWINFAKIKKGPIFVKFSKGPKITKQRLTDQTVALIIKEYLLKAGIDNKNYSGHSLRSGFATSAAESGAEERSIMAMTGHKSSDMVRRYIKEASLFKNNALNKIKF
jgi:site-specific recombinase XerD